MIPCDSGEAAKHAVPIVCVFPADVWPKAMIAPTERAGTTFAKASALAHKKQRQGRVVLQCTAASAPLKPSRARSAVSLHISKTSA